VLVVLTSRTAYIKMQNQLQRKIGSVLGYNAVRVGGTYRVSLPSFKAYRKMRYCPAEVLTPPGFERGTSILQV
jgi:hypothetical protein